MNTTKQLVPVRVINLLKPEIKVKNGVIEQTPDLIRYLQASKAIEKQIQATNAELKAEMVKHGVKNIKGDWGSVGLARRLNWQVIGRVNDKFYRKVLDTTKLKAYFVANDKIPAGIDVSETVYLDRSKIK